MKVTKVKSLKKSNIQQKGKIRNATKVEDFGIKFDSKLELFTYRKLIENNIKDFKYAENNFIIHNPFIYNGDNYDIDSHRLFKLSDNKVRGISYTPDFTCLNEDKTGWIIETKGFCNESFPLRWKLFRKYLLDNGYKVDLYKPNNQGNVLKTIEIIKEKYYK